MIINRELSWLKFNERVLYEAETENMPILSKLRYSSIFSSNLDEFFMVRVASIKDQINIGYTEKDASGLTPLEVYNQINDEVHKLLELQYQITSSCRKELIKSGIQIIRKNDYTTAMIAELQHYFNINIFPVLTPMAVDFGRPFPLISNKNLYLAAKLMVNNTTRIALVQVPGVLSRTIQLASEKDEPMKFVLLEDVIEQFIDQLFIGHQLLSTCQFRITRNGDLTLIEEDADDLLAVIEEAIKLRKWGEAIRLEVSSNVDEWILGILKTAFHLDQNQIYYIKGILDQTLWQSFKVPLSKANLTFETYKPKVLPFMEKKSIFKTIRDNDVFLHHPYESFDYVINFIKQASKDPQVLAIKQTLYRVSGNSEIVKALSEAAEKGKQVTVLVELMARFDEENNINWAKKLEQRGVHVIYGILGLKTHSKITLVVRREKQKIRRYVHLSTGNYNDNTAKLYTDMAIITCKESYGSDASMFFNMISGFTNLVQTHILTVAPYALRNKFLDLINREIAFAKNGKKAMIIAKMNALVDTEIVNKLYEASQSGVQIKLIVRGICTLVPGVKNLSENIEVISILGEFLEHSRIYYFHNNHHPEVFLSSADWMTRNLNRRIELMFPIEDPKILERMIKILELYLKDNRKSWKMDSEGDYHKSPKDSKPPCIAQDILKSIQYTNNQEFIDKLKERK